MKIPLIRTLRRVKLRCLMAWRYHRRIVDTPIQPVIIVAEARTGSTLLADYLRCHSGVHVGGEVLNPFFAAGLRRKWISKRSAIRHIVHSLYYQPVRVSVVKLHLAHMAWHGVTLRDLEIAIPDVKFLVLYRGSLAEQFVSREIVRETRTFEDRQGRTQRVESLKVDVGKFVEFAEGMRQEYEEAINTVSDHHRMCFVGYEELAHNPSEAFESRICPFLEMMPVELKTSLRKQNRKSLRELVENFEELEPHLEAHTLSFDLNSADAHANAI